MGTVRVINRYSDFFEEITGAGTKLVVIYFTATWCRLCNVIEPMIEQLSEKYLNAVFIKVDVDKCKATTNVQGVYYVPTFFFYRNLIKLAEYSRPDPATIKSKIQQFYVIVESEESESPVSGQVQSSNNMDLSTFITKTQCECLNESDEHNFLQCLNTDDGYLESDCDEQLILSIAFSQVVKVHSLKIKAPKDNGPKNIKLYINQPTTIDFDMADSNTSVQNLTLSAKDIEEGNPIPLRFVKFQNVQNFQIFVKDNQSGSETTRIDHITVIGLPVSTTNMAEYKGVLSKGGNH